MAKVYFKTTDQILDAVTQTFDFLWPTATAMWNLRWQVGGYLSARPDATKEDLEGRFVIGSGIHGANIRRACIDHTWEQQQEQFARFLLINLCALYESWIKKVLQDLHITNTQYEKQLQFPTEVLTNNTKKGVWEVIDKITDPESAMLKNAFYDFLKSSKNYSTNLDNLLRCYRYFKEIRNSIIHNGGIADDKTEQAYIHFIGIATVNNLGVKEVPLHYPVVNNTPVRISLRGVIGFGDIIRKIIITVDTELSRSSKSEKEFHRRWLEMYKRKNSLKTQNTQARKRQINRLVKGLGFPEPARTNEIDEYLRNNQLVG